MFFFFYKVFFFFKHFLTDLVMEVSVRYLSITIAGAWWQPAVFLSPPRLILIPPHYFPKNPHTRGIGKSLVTIRSGPSNVIVCSWDGCELVFLGWEGTNILGPSHPDNMSPCLLVLSLLVMKKRGDPTPKLYEYNKYEYFYFLYNLSTYKSKKKYITIKRYKKQSYVSFGAVITSCMQNL